MKYNHPAHEYNPHFPRLIYESADGKRGIYRFNEFKDAVVDGEIKKMRLYQFKCGGPIHNEWLLDETIEIQSKGKCIAREIKHRLGGRQRFADKAGCSLPMVRDFINQIDNPGWKYPKTKTVLFTALYNLLDIAPWELGFEWNGIYNYYQQTKIKRHKMNPIRYRDDENDAVGF